MTLVHPIFSSFLPFLSYPKGMPRSGLASCVRDRTMCASSQNTGLHLHPIILRLIPNIGALLKLRSKIDLRFIKSCAEKLLPVALQVTSVLLLTMSTILWKFRPSIPYEQLSAVSPWLRRISVQALGFKMCLIGPADHNLSPVSVRHHSPVTSAL